MSQQLSLAYDRRQIILERSEVAEGLAGQYVEVYDFADRPLEVRWKGHSLPYRIFSKDQRVSHTAIVENKRLRHALTTVKAQQDTKHLPKDHDQQRQGRIQEEPTSGLWARLRPKSDGPPRWK